MKIGCRSCCGLMVVVSVLVVGLFWGAPGDAVGQETAAEEESVAGEESSVTVGLFLGATTKSKTKGNETSFTMAAEYEYIGKGWGKWGVAGIVEAIFEEKMEFLFLPLAYYHIGERWFVRSGVGLELGREEEEDEIKAHVIWRTGVGYAIPIENFLVVPSFDLDLVRTDIAAAYGLVVAKEF